MRLRLSTLDRSRTKRARNHAIRPEVNALEPRQMLSGTEGLALAYGQLPLSFELNEGQTDPQVGFFARGGGYALFLTPTEAVLSLHKSTASGTDADPAGSDAVLSMQLVAPNSTPQFVGLDQLPGTTNYLIGNDPSQWHTDIPNYAQVAIRGVYPGVDLIYYGNQRQLEYDFTVAPGADPGSSGWPSRGRSRRRSTTRATLCSRRPAAPWWSRPAVLYQEADGVRQAVSGHYVLEGDGQVGFAVGSYDHSQPLVIDPILAYSTYLGGSDVDMGRLHRRGRGRQRLRDRQTDSTNFPTAHSLQGPPSASFGDAFVAKLNPAGSALVYSTYLGGSGGDRGLRHRRGRGRQRLRDRQPPSATQDFPTANALQPPYRRRFL